VDNAWDNAGVHNHPAGHGHDLWMIVLLLLQVLALKAVVFPLAARAAAEATKEGMKSAGLQNAGKLPTAAISIPLCFAFESASKKALPLPL
jgi:hypothetical protein